MNLVLDYFRSLYRESLAGWNRFWFTPIDPATLCFIRVLAGGMLFYTHLVWSLNLEEFFGPRGWLAPEAVATFQGQSYAWSYFWLIESPGLLWTVHMAALAVFLMFALGCYSRVTSVLSYLAAVAYVNRVPGALFGLDQINVMLAMYVMLGPSGARYSLDRWWQLRRAGKANAAVEPSVTANISLRLIQLHMCVIYLFAGLSKLMGPTWWEGTAMWGAIANLEYQSHDVLWLVRWPVLVNLMTHVTVAWEISYAALVWPRLTRPLVLLLAIPLHLGIAIYLGMVTFGIIMLVGNLAFVSPALVRACLEWYGRDPATSANHVPIGPGTATAPTTKPRAPGRRESKSR